MNFLPLRVGSRQAEEQAWLSADLRYVSTRLAVARRRRTASASLRSKPAMLGAAPARERQKGTSKNSDLREFVRV